MTYIINFQKKDSLGEIMFKLNELKVIKKFTKKEKIYLAIYLISCLLSMAANYFFLYAIRQGLKSEAWSEFVWVSSKQRALLILSMILIFTFLLWKLKKNF